MAGAEARRGGRKRMTLAVVPAPRAEAADLWLALGAGQGAPVDWLVESVVELGVARLVPVITQRTIVDKLNLDRMRAHIVEAAEQCRAPALADDRRAGQARRLPTALARRRARLFRRRDRRRRPRPPSRPARRLAHRPRGRLHPRRRRRDPRGPRPAAISLGPRILRAETAALAAVTAWMAAVGIGAEPAQAGPLAVNAFSSNGDP